MSKFNHFFDSQDKKYRKLEVLSGSSEGSNFTLNSHVNSSTLTISRRTGLSKGGEVVKGQTVFIKTNYQVAGKLVNGKRLSKADVGSHASASLDYINNHGAEDIKDDIDMSNVYDENGERMKRDDFDTLKKEMKEEHSFNAFRRDVVSFGQGSDISREDYVNLVRDIQTEFQEQTGKNYEFKIAVHTDHENFHAHVVKYGRGKDISMNKDQMRLYKKIAASKEEKFFKERDLNKDKSVDKLLNKEIKKVKELLSDKEVENVISKVLNQNQNKEGLSL